MSVMRENMPDFRVFPNVAEEKANALEGLGEPGHLGTWVNIAVAKALVTWCIVRRLSKARQAPTKKFTPPEPCNKFSSSGRMRAVAPAHFVHACEQ